MTTSSTLVMIDDENRRVTVVFPDESSLTLHTEDNELAHERAVRLGYISEWPVLGSKEIHRQLALWRELKDRVLLHVHIAYADGRRRSHTLCGSLTRRAIEREERLVEFCQKLHNIGMPDA